MTCVLFFFLICLNYNGLVHYSLLKVITFEWAWRFVSAITGSSKFLHVFPIGHTFSVVVVYFLFHAAVA